MLCRPLVGAAVALVALSACSRNHARDADDASTSSASAVDESSSGEEGDDETVTPTGSPPREGAAGAALLGEVDRELSVMRESTYSHATHVDETTATFDYDCSGFLTYALSRAVPDAIAAVRATTSRRPRSAEFVAYLQSIPIGKQKGRWGRIGRAADLEPGDVIVWLKPADSRSSNTGHTMTVHGAPTADPNHAGELVVPVADSTASAHGSGDTRAAAHRTGLGQGEIVLVTDADGAPIGYRWSRAATSRVKQTTIMLGRLR